MPQCPGCRLELLLDCRVGDRETWRCPKCKGCFEVTTGKEVEKRPMKREEVAPKGALKP